MAAKVGDLAWAGRGRLIWLVLAVREGMVIRNGAADWRTYGDANRPLGMVDVINSHGLEPIDDDTKATLTDEEWVLVAKGALLYA